MQTVAKLSSTAFLALGTLAALGLAAVPAHAGTTINFDSFTTAAQNGGGFVAVTSPYSTQGFTLTSGSNQFFAFAGTDPNYGDGETSLYSQFSSTTTLTQDNGTPFSFNAIDLGNVPTFANNSGNPSDVVLFTGTQVGGGTVTATDTVTAPVGSYQTFTFAGFNNLTSLVITPQTGVNPPQFDNVVLNAAPVPEASSTVSLGLMLALGLGGVAVMRRKRTQA